MHYITDAPFCTERIYSNRILGDSGRPLPKMEQKYYNIMY